MLTSREIHWPSAPIPARRRTLTVWLYRMRKIALKELRSRAGLPFAVRWSFVRRGFFSSSCRLYSRSVDELSDYVSDYEENIRAVDVNGIFAEVLDNKLLFGAVVGRLATTVETQAVVACGQLVPLLPGANQLGQDWIADALGRSEGLVLKPIDGASGHGVVRVTIRGGQFLWNREVLTREELDDRIATLDRYLASAVVSQADYAKEIFAGVANTVRILTMIEPATKEPFIAAAAHRFGTDASFPVDNCAAGGLTCPIDIERGVMGAGVTTVLASGTPVRHHTHPNSRSRIEGVVVPGWGDVKALALRLAGSLSILPCVGWDFVLTSHGPLVLEGNNGPDLKLHQVHRPLLADPRVRAFFEHHRVIRPHQR